MTNTFSNNISAPNFILKDSTSITLSNIDSRVSTLETWKADFTIEMLKKVYPVGSIYTSFSSTSPADLFGFGTWEQITNRFLYCANSSGTTGGEETHTLTIKEMPAHNHTIIYRGWHHVCSDKWNTTCIGHNFTGDGDQNNGTLASYNTGSTEAHNNMPPYITVYCWRRTA